MIVRPLQPVVSGVIVRDDSVLIAQRNETQSFPLKWEFPGGKIEPNESLLEALRRELMEELGINPLHPTCIGHMWVETPEKVYYITQFKVDTFLGEPTALAGQKELQWVPFAKLKNYDCMPSQYHLIDRLPEIMSK